MIAAWGETGFEAGSRWPLDGPSLAARVLETGRPERIDDYSELSGTIANGVREGPIRSTVGVPIVVDGKIVGAIGASGVMSNQDAEVAMAGAAAAAAN